MRKIAPKMHAWMMNPFLQFFILIGLSIKIMIVVAGGHGGTRE